MSTGGRPQSHMIGVVTLKERGIFKISGVFRRTIPNPMASALIERSCGAKLLDCRCPTLRLHRTAVSGQVVCRLCATINRDKLSDVLQRTEFIIAVINEIVIQLIMIVNSFVRYGAQGVPVHSVSLHPPHGAR